MKVKWFIVETEITGIDGMVRIQQISARYVL